MGLPQFFAAPFSQDGQFKRVSTSRLCDLSSDWLGLCGQIVQKHGDSFRASFAPELKHIEVHVNSASGFGIGVFCVHGRIVVSTAYLRGHDIAAERDVVPTLIESFRQAQKVRRTKAIFLSFADLGRIKERPLHVVVAWDDPAVSDDDKTAAGNMANHFAAAYLCRDELEPAARRDGLSAAVGSAENVRLLAASERGVPGRSQSEAGYARVRGALGTTGAIAPAAG